MKEMIRVFLLFFILGFYSCAQNHQYDLIIYGGTSAGIVAAVQAKKMGKNVLIIEPGSKQQLGGLTTGGLGRTDFGNKSIVGGLALEFYKDINRYYLDETNWKFQTREEYFKNQNIHPNATNINEESMWFFEPSAARKVFQSWLDENDIPIIYGERVQRSGESKARLQNGLKISDSGKMSEGIEKKDGKITKIVMESGNSYSGKIFIDATYEGDLLAGAGVSFAIGREGFDVYGESLNGFRPERAIPKPGTESYRHHQFEPSIDPYIVPENPNSGLLLNINRINEQKLGQSDHRIQAYCFRMCLTDDKDNQIPFEKPENYDEKDYELLFRNYEAGFSRLPWINSPMPNRKTDTNNQSAFSTDFIGMNYEYPEGSYDERNVIVNNHRKYQQGLMWTLANHPRIPDSIRNEISKWGLTKDEFKEKNGWQDQLYIREARRMISEVVMTQHHCEGKEIVEESVGLGAYGMDSHHVQRYVDENEFVKNEGDIQIGVPKPYPISYKSIVPKRSECENLVVPVCLSASHIAFGSIRMEPIFMILGQSAAVAACLAIDNDISLQDLKYEALKGALIESNQNLY